jgi:WD40 repeat protein
MNDTRTEHPNANELSEFGLGRLGEEASRTIEAHIESCPDCRRRVEEQADDSLVVLLRTSAGSQPASESATLAHVESTSETAIGPGEVPAELAEHSRYRILEVLGHGGMGVVYRARHLLMERDVALKVVNRTLLDSPVLVERFRREVKSAARLLHPNIVTAYDADQAGDWHFLVMEFVPGVSLARVVSERGPLPVVEACGYARQAALALQHAAQQGMVHRDVKPQNLMLTPAGQVKVLDFGLSLLCNEAPADPCAEQGGSTDGSITQVGSVMGTPDYIAPEQARDAHSADIRADVYSLGCTLYFLLAGQPPFPDGSSFDKILAHFERTPTPLQEVRPEVPAKLSAVVARMMAKAPKDRYQTPAEVAEALAPFTGAVRLRRRWAWAALLMLGVGLAVAGYAGRGRLPHDPRGQVVVEAPSRAGLLALHKDGKRVAILDLQKEPSCKLDPGDYSLSLIQAPDDLYLPVERCRVAPGTATTIRLGRVEVVREFHDQVGGFVCLAFTPDGKRFLSGGYGNPLKLWDLASGKTLRVFDCPKGANVWAIALSPDGRSVAWGAGTKIILSDLDSGREIRVFEGHQDTVVSLAFSPDGARLVSSAIYERGLVHQWDVRTGEELTTFSLAGSVWSVAYTPDGLHVLASQFTSPNRSSLLRLFDDQEKRDVHRLDGSRGASAYVVVISRDGRRVLAGCDERVMILWDLETGKEIQRFVGHTGGVRSVAFLPDDRYVLSGSYDGTVRLWEVAGGKQLYCFTRHEGGVKSALVAPDGCHALTAGDDKVIRLWRLPVPDPPARPAVTTGELVVQTHRNAGLLVIKREGRRVAALDLTRSRSCTLEAGDYDFELTAAPDDLTLASKRCHIAPGAKSTIRIDQGKVVNVYKGLTLPGGGVCVAVTRDGKHVLAGGWGNPLRMWDVETGKEERVFDCPGPKDVWAIALSPDGRSVAWGAGPIIRRSDLETGEEIGTFLGHQGTITGLDFSPHGKRLLSSSADGTARLWDVKSRRELIKPFVLSTEDWAWSAAFTPDGRNALTSRHVKQKTHVGVQLWDLQTRVDLHRLDNSRGTSSNHVAILSADGRRALSAGDDKMRLWDLESGKELHRFEHKGGVRNVAFLPDGRVMSVGAGGMAQIHDASSGRLLYTFSKHRETIKGVAIAPDGRHAFTVSGDGVIFRWRLPRFDPAPQR